MVLPVHNPIIYPPAVANYENGKLPDGLLWSTPGQARGPVIRLTESATRSWRAMTAAAKSAGHTLKATSSADSYRSYLQQEATFVARYEPDAFPGFIDTRWWPGHYNARGIWIEAHRWYQKPNTAVAAVPGTSNHGWGLAVDIGEESDGDAGTESIDAASLNWLIANAHHFGWSAEIQSEPWHWRRYSGDVVEPAVLAYEEALLMAADYGNLGSPPNIPDFVDQHPDIMAADTYAFLTQGKTGWGPQTDAATWWFAQWMARVDAALAELKARPPVQAAPVDIPALAQALAPMFAASAAEARDAVADLGEGGAAQVREDA